MENLTTVAMACFAALVLTVLGVMILAIGDLFGLVPLLGGTVCAVLAFQAVRRGRQR